MDFRWRSRLVFASAFCCMLACASFTAPCHGQGTVALVAPQLAPMPTTPAWPKSTKADLDKQLAAYPKSAVMTYFALVSALDSTSDDGKVTDAGQRAWLTTTRDALLPYVKALLEAEYREAVAGDDLRWAIVATAVLQRLGNPDKTMAATDLVGRLPDLAPMIARHVRGEGRSKPVWKITGAQSQPCREYTERMESGLNSYTITVRPPDGQRLVRISAQVRNIAAQADPPYVMHGVSPALCSLLALDSQFGKGVLANYEFVYLTTAGGTTYPCRFVTKNTPVLRGDMTDIIVSLFLLTDKQDAANAVLQRPIGSFVALNAEFKLDLLFAVPESATGLELWFVGCPPVALTPTK